MFFKSIQKDEPEAGFKKGLARKLSEASQPSPAFKVTKRTGMPPGHLWSPTAASTFSPCTTLLLTGALGEEEEEQNGPGFPNHLGIGRSSMALKVRKHCAPAMPPSRCVAMGRSSPFT